MTSLLIWFLAILVYNKSKAHDCKNDLIRNASFHCDFILDATFQTLFCKSNILPQTKVFFDLHLQLTAKIPFSNIPQSFYQIFLNSTFNENSAFYSCKNIPSFWGFDPLIDDDVCSRQDICLPQVSQFLEPSFINHLNVTSSQVHLADFQDLTELTVVTVTNVSLLNISGEFFKNLNTLKFLNLSNNGIPYLEDELLTNQKILEVVDLSTNQLTSFPKEAFGVLPSLRVLNISHNLINSISVNDFKIFPNLSELDLSNNKLITLNVNTFYFNELLSKLVISHNNLRFLPDKLLQNSRNLKWFSCSRCLLKSLKDDLFENNPNLLIVDFSENFIETLPNGIFQNHSLIEYVNLNNNKLSRISPLKNKPRLLVLKLSHNYLTSLDEDTFLEAPHLYTIDLSKNILTTITDNHFKHLQNIGNLDLSENVLRNIELGKTTKLNVRNLNLSHNAIEKFDVEWRSFVFLEIIDVEGNEIEFLNLPPCVPNFKQTITFLFKNNKITNVGFKSLLKDERRAETDRNMAGCLFNGLSKNFIDITHNSLICDCHLYPLKNYVTKNRRIKLDSFIHLGNLSCENPPPLKNELITELPNDMFSCPVTENCPIFCTCGMRGQDNKTFVNCTNVGLFQVPQNVPLETTILYFNNNHLRDLQSLNAIIWRNLTEIYANENDISTLDGWDIPKDLKYLYLKGNNVEQIPDSFTDFLANQSDFHLYLGYHDKNCHCNKKRLKNFLLKNKIFIKDNDNITCEIDNNGTKSILPLSNIPNSILCPMKMNQNSKMTLIWLCSLFVFLLTTLLVYYKQRQLILSFLFLHCEQLFHIFCDDSETDDDKVFDAFIAYSSCNRDIVMDLLHELEKKEPFFQLCIHERDWLPGRYISDNIIHSVQSSKRIIIVLSDTFISSPWFRLELRAAVFKVSKDKMCKIIVILADRTTSLEGIDPELRPLITKRTYLVWGERWFWEKLRYAMPHTSCDPRHEIRVDENRRNSSEMELIKNENAAS